MSVILYLDQLIYPDLLTPIEINDAVVMFKPLTASTSDESTQLAQLYMSLFNADNKNVMTKFNIEGRTVPEGLWLEEPYTLEKAYRLISDYQTTDYFGCMAYATLVKNASCVLGASIVQERTKEQLLAKGYELPFAVPPNITYWAGIDTFRRPFLRDGQPQKGLAKELTQYLVLKYKKATPVLYYSSSNNPQRVRSWQTAGFTIVERPTTFGNKFQAFKLVE